MVIILLDIDDFYIEEEARFFLIFGRLDFYSDLIFSDCFESDFSRRSIDRSADSIFSIKWTILIYAFEYHSCSTH